MDTSETIELIEAYDRWRTYRADFMRFISAEDLDSGVRPQPFQEWLAAQ